MNGEVVGAVLQEGSAADVDNSPERGGSKKVTGA